MKPIAPYMLVGVILLATLGGPGRLSAAASPFSDEFNNPSLDPRWRWLNEDSGRWSLTALPGNLRIVATIGDMVSYCGGFNTKNVLLQDAPQGYFEISTRVSINPTVDYQQAALFAFNNPDNYVKLGVAHNSGDYGGQAAEVILVENGQLIRSQRPWLRVSLDRPAYLKLVRVYSLYSGYYSSDGQNWMLVGSVNSTIVSSPQIGLTALNSCFGNPPDIPADFDYFRVSTSHVGKTSIFIGQGFDKCGIPTLNQLQTWITNGPYRVVNLYIGGSRRSCANTALTSSYVTQLSKQGWRFIPTWVGPQCLYDDISDDPTTAYNQGVAEANTAITAAANLGLTLPDSSGTIIYYDMEGYTSQNPNCRDPSKSFIAGWTAQLHTAGNLSGVYGSSCASNISDFAAISDIPDAIWPAGGGFFSTEYDPNATIWGNRCVADDLWNNHQRIYQYTEGHQETWGRVSLTIDSNVIDGIVADLGVSYRLYLPVINKH